MKNKKQFTLIELIIVIVVIGILAAMAIPKFNGVVRGAKLAAMINDKETLEKTLVLYYQKYDELPLLNEDENLIVNNQGISLTKIVLAEDNINKDMQTIYKSLQETLTYYNDSEETLYRIDINELKDNLSKDIKYGHKKHDKDFYVYSMKTGNVYYYDFVVNGNGTIQHSEYDTLCKDTIVVDKTPSPEINETFLSDEEISQIKIKTIALGNDHSMKIGMDENLYSWGSNNYGQLGIGSTINQTTPQKVNLPNGEKPISIYCGHNYSMTITNKGNVYAWGSNNYGQLGIDNTINQTTPQKVTLPNDEKPVDISLGGTFTGILTNKGNLYSCGYNYFGGLGIGNNENQSTLQKVILPNDEKAKSISFGNAHFMVLTDKNNLYTAGYNIAGQLGIGTFTNKNTPTLVTLNNGEYFISINAGSNISTGITNKNNTYSWGSNASGQLGFGVLDIKQNTPHLVTIPNGEYLTSIHTKGEFVMGFTNKNNLYGWGDNRFGELGTNKNTSFQLSPTLINHFNKITTKSITTGYYNSILVDIDGNTYVWGKNNNSQLGIGNTVNQLTPIKIDLP